MNNNIKTIKKWVCHRFSIDLRALATLRILTGGVLLLDIILRWRNLTAFYTDKGVLPRSALFSDYTHVYTLHGLFGSTASQVVFFIIGAFLAGLLIIGYRPKVMAFLSFLFIFSLHNRNPMVLNSGDTLLRLLLMWSIFLPTGVRWSVNNINDNSQKISVVKPATAAIIMQVWFVYVVNLIHKLRGDAWLSGNAVGDIFNLGQFTVLLGPYISKQPELLIIFNYLWLFMLFSSLLLPIASDKIRTVVTSLLIVSHTGMLLTMQLGIFPLVSIASLVLFYPKSVWDQFETKCKLDSVPSLVKNSMDRRIYTSSDRKNRILSEFHISELLFTNLNFDYRLISVLYRIWSIIITVVLFIGILLSLFQSIGIVGSIQPAGESVSAMDIDQSWEMFAPEPLKNEAWYVVPGILTNESKVDIYSGNKINFSQPDRIDRTYETARWRKYLKNVRTVSNTQHRLYYAQYLCSHWNRTNQRNVTSIQVFTVVQPTDSNNSIPKRLIAIKCKNH